MENLTVFEVQVLAPQSVSAIAFFGVVLADFYFVRISQVQFVSELVRTVGKATLVAEFAAFVSCKVFAHFGFEFRQQFWFALTVGFKRVGTFGR